MPGLTALQVKNAKPGRHADWRGLYLLVRESGSRSWVPRTQVNGRRQDLGLGSVSRLSLSKARTKAEETRLRLMRGEAARPAPPPAPFVLPTFREAAIECHEAIKAGWFNKRHSDSWLTSLKTHIFPAVGDTPVDQISSIMVRDSLAPIWLRIPETARRIFQRIGTVLDYAHLQGWCPHEAALRSVPKGLPRENHFVALPYDELPALIRQLSVLPSMSESPSTGSGAASPTGPPRRRISRRRSWTRPWLTSYRIASSLPTAEQTSSIAGESSWPDGRRLRWMALRLRARLPRASAKAAKRPVPVIQS